MSGRPAILARLTHGLALIGLVGGILLTILLVIDLELWFGKYRLDLRGLPGVTELELSILLSFAVTVAAMVGAARILVNRALAPFETTTSQIDEALHGPPGFRIDERALPVEVAGFGVAINRLLDRLELLAAERELFAAQVAHELRNPLAVLLFELDSIGSEHARRLRGDVQHMERLLDQLLIMARLQSQTKPPQPTLVDLAELASELLASIAPAAIAQGRAVELVIDRPASTCGYPELISIALRNLIDNALRVTPAGGTVTVTVGPDASLACADGGPGLTRSQFDELRVPFAQSRHPSATGAGLGLAIIDRIAMLHSGTVTTDPTSRSLRLSLER